MQQVAASDLGLLGPYTEINSDDYFVENCWIRRYKLRHLIWVDVIRCVPT